MVCVGFVSPDMKVEIEADALVMWRNTTITMKYMIHIVW
jgi:hypothetical protein